LVGEIQDIDRFDSAKKLAAYAGVTPENVQSGTSVDKPASLSKIGSSRLRSVLYMPAIVARRHNPIIRKFCRRLDRRGKHKKSIIAAAMHKLIRLVYGVWSNETAFDPDYLKAAH
jgi:transposase